MKIESIKRPWVKDEGHRHNHRGDRSFYQTASWRNTRNAFMKQHPNCVECGKTAHVCDHKVRIAEGGSELDWNNLQAMCHSCHNKKDNNAR